MEAFLVIGFVVIAAWVSYRVGRYILKERYFASEDFLAHKNQIASFVAEHNELADYISEIRTRGSFELGQSYTGSQAHLASFQNTSHWNYPRWKAVGLPTEVTRRPDVILAADRSDMLTAARCRPGALKATSENR